MQTKEVKQIVTFPPVTRRPDSDKEIGDALDSILNLCKSDAKVEQSNDLVVLEFDIGRWIIISGVFHSYAIDENPDKDALEEISSAIMQCVEASTAKGYLYARIAFSEDNYRFMVTLVTLMRSIYAYNAGEAESAWG